MAEYFYIAVDRSGKIERGSLIASNPDLVKQILVKKGLELISCQEMAGKSSLAQLDVGDLFQSIFHRHISAMEKISFTNQLAVMLKAGVPFVEAVEVLGTDITNPRFRKIIKNLAADLESGKNISLLLEKENLFSKAHIAIIKAGEATGNIEGALSKISLDLKRDYQITKKIKGAMSYPLIIIMALIGISGFIIVFVLPKIGDVFEQMDLKIPLATRILLAVGSFINSHFLAVGLSLVGFIAFLVILLKFTNIASKFFIPIFVNLPVIKKLIRQIGMARFIRTLSSLLSSGVPIAQSLSISGQVFTNQNYKKIIIEAVRKIEKGVTLTGIFRANKKYFDSLLIKMCSVGEKSGSLAEILEEVAEFYEAEVDDKLQNISSIIEPILMLMVGLGVGAMVLSIIGPIYQMIGTFTQ